MDEKEEKNDAIIPSAVMPSVPSGAAVEELAKLIARQLLAGNGKAATGLQSIGIASAAETMPLSHFIENHYLVEREVTPPTAAYYLWKVKTFSAWLGRTAMLSDLNDETVNRFLIARAKTVKPDTVKGDKATLVSWWLLAVRNDLLEMPPRKLRKLKRTHLSPRGWTGDQLRILLNTAKSMKGDFRGKGVARASFWKAFILTAYCTGLRLGDLLRLETADVTGPGSITVIQSKTGRPVDTGISPEAWAAIKATNPEGRKFIFGFITRNGFFPAFREFLKAAGITGGTKYLRRTSGSMVESIAPGQGHKHLGHSDTGETFNRHYNVREFTRRDPVLPPSITTEGQA